MKRAAIVGLAALLASPVALAQECTPNQKHELMVSVDDHGVPTLAQFNQRPLNQNALNNLPLIEELSGRSVGYTVCITPAPVLGEDVTLASRPIITGDGRVNLNEDDFVSLAIHVKSGAIDSGVYDSVASSHDRALDSAINSQIYTPSMIPKKQEYKPEDSILFSN